MTHREAPIEVLESLAERLWARTLVLGPDDCWPWQGPLRNGYGQMWVGPEKGSKMRVHRLAWTLKHGPTPEGMDVCHRCDNRPCCNDTHMFLGTNADNTADKVAKGRQRRGELQPSSKLTAEQVADIRRRKAKGESLRALSAAFGVANSQIHRIVHREDWRHVS